MADFTHVFSKDAAPRKLCFFPFCFVLNYLVYIVCVWTWTCIMANISSAAGPYV